MGLLSFHATTVTSPSLEKSIAPRHSFLKQWTLEEDSPLVDSREECGSLQNHVLSKGTM